MKLYGCPFPLIQVKAWNGIIWLSTPADLSEVVAKIDAGQ